MTIDQIGQATASLVQKGLLSVEWSTEENDFVFSLTEKGKQVYKLLKAQEN